MGTATRIYQGESAAERAEARRRRLLDAAYAAMSGEGWSEMSINKLCAQAGLNKRYFYESFQTLDELAAAVMDEVLAGVIEAAFQAATRAAAEGVSTEALAHMAIRSVVTHLTDEPQRARVLFTEVADSPLALAKRREAINRLADALSGYAHYLYRVPDKRIPVASLTAYMLVGGTIEALLGWLDGEIPMSRDQLIADLAALWISAGDAAVARAMAQPGAGKKRRGRPS